MVLGQLPPRKIAPNPKTNTNLDPDSNPNRGVIFHGGQLSPFLLHAYMTNLFGIKTVTEIISVM